MNYKALFVLLLIPFYAFSREQSDMKHLFFSGIRSNQNAVVRSYTNESSNLNEEIPLNRTINYPTQIIRIDSLIDNQSLDCKQVNDTVDELLIQHIKSDKFTYNFYILCEYNPDTHLAQRLVINSYFDPIDDSAIEFLKTYLSEYNGRNFLGIQLKIESAKGLIISLNINSGIKKNPKTPLFIQYRADRSNFYFKSNYEMRQNLIEDIRQNFYTNDPNKILPFLNKWFFASASTLYKTILSDSNFIELQPERIFLMNEGGDIFVSYLKYYFSHDCNEYENHRCLPQGTAL